MNDFHANTPIYLQVMDDIKMQIMNGTLKPGGKLPSVRELASTLEVNPNTIQRAFVELEREGFMRTERAVGRFVADNQALIDECRDKQIKKIITLFIEQMQQLGISKEEILQYLKEDDYGRINSYSELK